MPIIFNPHKIISKPLSDAIQPKTVQHFVQASDDFVKGSGLRIIPFSDDIATQKVKQFTSDSLKEIISEVQKNRYDNGFNIIKLTSDEKQLLNDMYEANPKLARTVLSFLSKNETPFTRGFPSMEEFLAISEAHKKNPEFIQRIVPMTRIALEPGVSPLFARRLGENVPRFDSKSISSISDSYQINPSLTRHLVEEQYTDFESGERLYTHTANTIKYFVEGASKNKKRLNLYEQIFALSKQCDTLDGYEFKEISEKLKKKSPRIASRFMGALSTIKPKEGYYNMEYYLKLKKLIDLIDKNNIKYFEQICAKYQDDKVIRVPSLNDIVEMMTEFNKSPLAQRLSYRFFG